MAWITEGLRLAGIMFTMFALWLFFILVFGG
jgi:hypothetical protein